MKVIRRKDIRQDGAEMRLYRRSFPEHEQRDWQAQRAALDQPDYHFDTIVWRERFAGLVLWWEAANFIYVEHFCVEPELRGHGLGSRAIKMLEEKGKPVILEIDPPVDEISVRRKGFYERAGFAANPWPHVHPPYHPGNRGHDLVIMSAPCALTQSECKRFQRYLRSTVMTQISYEFPENPQRLWDLLNALDRETDCMMFEPGERGQDPAKARQLLDRARLQPEQTFLITAAVEGVPVGILAAERGSCRRTAHSACVDVGIREGWRGRGIGMALFARLDAWARANRLLRLELAVERKNAPALRLFQKNGFEIEGTRRMAMRVGGELRDVVEMAKLYPENC